MSGETIGRQAAQAPRWLETERAWLITRYADAARLLKSEDVVIVEVSRELQKLSDRLGGAAFANMILLFGTSHPFQDGEAHSSTRAPLKELLSNTSRRWTAERIDDLAATLLAPFEAGERGDAVSMLARALPAAVVADTLGMDVEHVHQCGRLARELSTIWHRDTFALRDLWVMEETAIRLVELLSVQCGNERRPDFARLAFLSMAGVDTTAGLLGSAIHHLSLHPDLQERIRKEPALTAGFINETLRCCPPLRRIVGRKAARDVELSSITLPRGALLVIDLESAHRDSDAFPDPDQFDAERKGPPTLAFGFGAHACLGAALARLEAKVLIERLLRNFVVYSDGEARRSGNRDWYEFENLPIRLERQTPCR